MKYVKFKIENFKGIPNLTLDLNNKPTMDIFTLVGLNESGKTSILEAVDLLQNDILKSKAHTLIPKKKQHGFNGSVSVRATVEFQEKDILQIKKYLKKNYKFNIEEINPITVKKKYNFSGSSPVEDGEKNWKESLWDIPIKGKTNRGKYTKSLKEWSDSADNDAWRDVLNKIKQKHLPKILYYPDFLFQFPERIYLEKFSGEGSEQEEYRGILQDILDSIDDGLVVEDDLLAKMKNKDKPSHKESLEQLLLKMSSKLDEEILEKWGQVFGSGQGISVNIKEGTERIQDNKNRHYIELKIQQGSSYSINERSLGFRWFFSFLIFTAFRKSRISDPGETLFLLDEPASNLHQRSQQKLLQELENIVSDCKLIYSTHSHHLINPKWLSGSYIVRNKAVNYENPEEADIKETEIDADLYKRFAAQHPDESDHFKPILDSLDYMPSKLEMVPDIIFTEGKNDYYTFRYFAEVMFKGDYDLNFYPGAGKDKYENIFRLYIAWRRNFLVLFDADKGGKDSIKAYKKKIGLDMEDRAFTLVDVYENWVDFTTENLFDTEKEKLRIIQKSFPEHTKKDGFHKSKFNTAIQQLYINNEKFDFNKPTIKRFRKIFDFLEAKNKFNNERI